jgi:hypothetical protein
MQVAHNALTSGFVAAPAGSDEQARKPVNMPRVGVRGVFEPRVKSSESFFVAEFRLVRPDRHP